MKLATCQVGNAGEEACILTEHGILPLSSVNRRAGTDWPTELFRIIGEGRLDAMEQWYAAEKGSWMRELAIPPEDARFAPLYRNPRKIWGIGFNYVEDPSMLLSRPPDEEPVGFMKPDTTIIGHLDTILIPRQSNRTTAEAELAIIIGKRANHVSPDEALDHVFGYATANDLSARDLQMRTPQWLLGKTCDGFCPLGPYLVTADEIPDPNQLWIRCTVNGELRQNSNTSDMIFYCKEIISYLSRHMTLVPGDVILTGTPEGVILGYPPEKQVYLKPGDMVTVEIEKLGALTNRMV